MTIAKAIARFDTLYPNAFSYADKILWLSELDGVLFNEFLSSYDENKNKTFSGYTINTDKNTQLLIPFPYEEIYIKYLAAQCDRVNSDTARYSNSSASFNTAVADFMNYYNRSHKISAVRIKG